MTSDTNIEMKIVAKHKKSSQNLWESFKQPDTFKSKEIGFHMDSSQETLKAVLHAWNAAGTPQKEVIFASDCYW